MSNRLAFRCMRWIACRYFALWRAVQRLLVARGSPPVEEFLFPAGLSLTCWHTGSSLILS